jgi:hypothetical protein
VQSHYPFAFEREMGCTADELRAWLPGASAGRAIEWLGDGGAALALDAGRVALRWQALPPRRIALITLPRLLVSFEASGVDEGAWQAFMRHFDLFTQRGGG